MDKPTPECMDRRWIVAEDDGLDEIEVSLTLPPFGDADQDDALDLRAEAYFGVTLVRKERRAANRFVFSLVLPRPLAAGQEHQYSLITRLPANQPMRQHYVFFPERRCDDFDLRLRFDLDNPPVKVWRVAEAFHREIDLPVDGRPTLPVDRIGEAHLTFEHLRPGHGYGARWSMG